MVRPEDMRAYVHSNNKRINKQKKLNPKPGCRIAKDQISVFFAPVISIVNILSGQFMKFIQRIKKSKYHLLFSVLPVVILVGLFKVAVHHFEWEMIPKEMTSFFPSILTGIIFILGFLLAGVVTDYKESEKIPNELAASLYAIWQEADYLRTVSGSKSAEVLMGKIKGFIPSLKDDFFVLQNNRLQELIDSFSADIVEIGKEGAAPNYVMRMKSEVASLKKTINRISVIKNTDFIPSVFICIKTIAFIFLSVYCLLVVDPWWGGLILVSIFTFVIFSILFLIKDMEDPFGYDGSGEIKSDEISLQVLENLQGEFEQKMF